MKYFFPHKMTEEVISERQKRQGKCVAESGRRSCQENFWTLLRPYLKFISLKT